MWIWNCTEQVKEVILKRIHDFKLNPKHPALLEILYEKDVITASEMDELSRYSWRFDTPRDMDKLVDIVSRKQTMFFEQFLFTLRQFLITLKETDPIDDYNGVRDEGKVTVTYDTL